MDPESGNPARAAFDQGLEMGGQGDAAGAAAAYDAAYQLAVNSGDPGISDNEAVAREATIRLGGLLESMGRPDEAEPWYRLAVSYGDTGSMIRLANLLVRRGRVGNSGCPAGRDREGRPVSKDDREVWRYLRHTI
jgi:hypothetical protein